MEETVDGEADEGAGGVDGGVYGAVFVRKLVSYH